MACRWAGVMYLSTAMCAIFFSCPVLFFCRRSRALSGLAFPPAGVGLRPGSPVSSPLLLLSPVAFAGLDASLHQVVELLDDRLDIQARIACLHAQARATPTAVCLTQAEEPYDPLHHRGLRPARLAVQFRLRALPTSASRGQTAAESTRVSPPAGACRSGSTRPTGRRGPRPLPSA